MSSPHEERLAGALIGLALGDALGFVVEAEPPPVAGAYARLLRDGGAGSRAHPHFPFGQYSDDTQLARELLLCVDQGGRWDPGRFARRVATLVRDGRDVGAGPATRTAAMRVSLGAPWPHAGAPVGYAGNGSAMRAAPLGVLYGEDEHGWRESVREQSRVTHHDPRCAAGAIAVAGAAVLAGTRASVRVDEFVDRLAAWVEPEHRGLAAAVRALPGWVGLDPARAVDRLRAAGLDPGQVGTWQGISAHVVPSVVWSLYAFLRTPDDWWETVCTAIEVGGDTDSMAAMAGAIAGAWHGVAALPGTLIVRLTDRGEWDGAALIGLARRCAAAVGSSRGGGGGSVIVAGSTPR